MKKEEVTKSIETKDNESGGLQGQSFPGCFINMSSSGLTRGSRKKESMLLDSGSAAGMTRGDESGRSMVEMLGVLAIMGVLAIGGIAGYRWAMDKYNANEILNEVRKRAVTASQQRILGHAINLSEYGNNTIQGHAVTTADSYNGDTSFFALTVSGIEKDICDKVIKEKIPFAVEEKVGEVVVGDDTTCAKGNSNTITFAFKNALDGEAALPEPEPDPDPACEGVECPTGTSCSKGICICSGTGQEVCGTTCCDTGQMCQSDVGGCVAVSGKCANNTDCKDTTKYCQIIVTNCYGNRAQGTCVNKGDALTDTNRIKITDASGNTLMTVWKGPSYMNWWSARNWCAAHGKKLIDISSNRLGCYKSDGTTPFGATTTGYCCAKDQASCGSTVGNQSALMQALRTAYDSGDLPKWVWMDTSYDSCSAFSVTLDRGGVSLENRANRYSYYALCE